MSYSLNEIEAMAKRAARGAGLDWGLAEETGKAARWLASHDLPGPELLSELLKLQEAEAYEALAPQTGDAPWQAKSGSLSPLVCGAAVCDLAEDLAKGQEITLARTAYPLLLVPFVAAAAKLTQSSLSISWRGLELVLSPEGLFLDGPSEDLQCPEARELRCSPCTPRGPNRVARWEHRTVEPAVWERLGAFAQRTFAPATEASRLAGAGAGLSDND